MKTLLFTLNASHAHSSLSLRCLRDALLEGGFEADILEATAKDRTHAVLAKLHAANADLYGFSCYIWNLDQMLALAADLKALRPTACIVLGGPEVSFDEERFTALPFVDCVIKGEGEAAILTVAETIKNKKAPERVVFGAAYDKFLSPGIRYRKDEPVTPLVYYESSRGCPFSCAFCLSSAEEGVRAKPADVTLADLLAFEAFDVPFTVKLVDRTFNFDRRRTKEIWRGLLDKRYTKCYHFEVAAHLLDEESLEILSQFPEGKVRLEIGLQSTNEKTLAAISRHTDAKAVLKWAKRLTDMGNVHVHLDLIAGLPHEDLASFARSFDAAYPCCHVLQLGFLKLLHGTALRRQAAANGTVFSQKSPYTVLETADLSFAELEQLHAVDDLVERLQNSGRFRRTLALLLPDVFTPFAFFAGFAAFLSAQTAKELQQISQRDLFLLLSRFAKGNSPEQCHFAISEALRADFAATEVRRPPAGL
ncbi:MAG: DUF4080 domain-containing protein [Clostridia bacterium]|nr:DUF4080 domain-containing protein [Clostridia bacterium]